MAGIHVGRENSKPIYLHYEDQGWGRPVVLIHGWPLASICWEKQAAALLDAGYRVITYDRRGFGRSSRPTIGYDFDTFAEDLCQLLKVLDLRDTALVGYAMGAGEVARYLGTYGADRVREAVAIAALPPFQRDAAGGPAGLAPMAMARMLQAFGLDRPAFLKQFLEEEVYNADLLRGGLVSDDLLRANWNDAINSSANGAFESLAAWATDFGDDLRRIDVPTLVIHGAADRVFALDCSGRPFADNVDGARLVVVEGGPHGLLWTHAARINAELLGFLA